MTQKKEKVKGEKGIPGEREAGRRGEGETGGTGTVQGQRSICHGVFQLCLTNYPYQRCLLYCYGIFATARLGAGWRSSPAHRKSLDGRIPKIPGHHVYHGEGCDRSARHCGYQKGSPAFDRILIRSAGTLTDIAIGGNLKPRESWAEFSKVGLSTTELKTIAKNRAPYFR